MPNGRRPRFVATARRLAGGLGAAACASLVAALGCGDRTGLEWDLLPANANVDGQATADGAAAAGNGACWSSSLDYTAGNNCTAGEQLLQCVVAASGNTIMYNYCVTSMPGCAEMADESSCQTQCNAGEYGVQCGQSTVPVSFGCRIVYPSPPMGAEGLAFCCTCN